MSMKDNTERRKRRSEDPIIALHYQLSALRSETGLDAVVLVDDAGCLVAGAGAWPTCEELAAYAPFIVHKESACTPEVAGRAAEIARDTTIRSLVVDGVEIMLCARGLPANDVTPSMLRAEAGCRRILSGDL